MKAGAVIGLLSEDIEHINTRLELPIKKIAPNDYIYRLIQRKGLWLVLDWEKVKEVRLLTNAIKVKLDSSSKIFSITEIYRKKEAALLEAARRNRRIV